MSEKQSVDSIFCSAIEIESTEERNEYLRGVCADDPELHRQLQRLADLEPTMIAFYIEEMADGYGKASIKQHLAAIRMLFDYFVTGGIIKVNPAASVRGPKLVMTKGKTPVLRKRPRVPS